MADIRSLAAKAAVAVTFTDASELDQLSFGGQHQNVVAAVRSPRPASIEDLLESESAGGPPLILAADQVQDVGNLGARCLRTLEAVDGAGAIVPGRRSAALTGGLARASAGASLRTPLVQVANIARGLSTSCAMPVPGSTRWTRMAIQTSRQRRLRPPNVPGRGRRNARGPSGESARLVTPHCESRCTAAWAH